MNAAIQLAHGQAERRAGGLGAGAAAAGGPSAADAAELLAAARRSASLTGIVWRAAVADDARAARRCRLPRGDVADQLFVRQRPAGPRRRRSRRRHAGRRARPASSAVTSCTIAPRRDRQAERRCSAGVTSVSVTPMKPRETRPVALQLRQDGHGLVDRHREADVARARADRRVDADHLAARR